MNKVTDYITLDLGKSVSGIILDVLKGDTERQIVATLNKNGHPYTISSGVSASMKAHLPSGVVISVACEVDDSVITADIDTDVTSMAGLAECEFCLTDTQESQITSPMFEIRVKGNLTVTESEGE